MPICYQRRMGIFRYSGSKSRVLKYLPAPPFGTKRIVEPFAGSAAYAIHYRPQQVVLAEANKNLRALWEWLRTEATVENLTDLEAMKPSEKVDARTLGLEEGPPTLVRLTVSGVYVGQLSSWTLLPQHKMDFSKLEAALPYIKDSVLPVKEDFRDTKEYDDGRSVFLIDPPYARTSANYIDKSDGQDLTKTMSAEAVSAFVRCLKSPVLFTYGSDAKDTFPDFDWKVACVRKVPTLRGGGTKERTEHYATLNWP